MVVTIKNFFIAADDAEEEAETFRAVVQQQREMQIKRAKEAEERKKTSKS